MFKMIQLAGFRLAVAAALALLLVPGGPTHAQGTSGVPGSPSATISIDGKQLPPPPQKFGGKIERTTKGSKPFWPARVVPPKGAPNVLLIITDDVGYGAPSTFGGVIPTPALDRIAQNGLRYTNFHSTALCSPTRAALITGRNHHSTGFGVISEQATGFPGYDSFLTKDKATIGTILKENGYRTSWFGKNHNTPSFQASAIGPFDQWPVGMGFEYFYGFMGGDTNQWQPANLARNTTYIYPFQGNPGFNLTTAMADEAIGYMNQVNTLMPEQPFLVYYAPGGTHAPHHPTPEWIKKATELKLFDKGWNELRNQIFANQKKLGVIPQDAKLTPWPKDLLKEWEQLSADEKKLFLRQVDVYAAYLMYTDHEIGRVIQAVEDMGKLDNTLIIYISGDNGSSAEGTLVGTPNEVAMFNGVVVPVEAQLKYFYDAWGSDRTYNHMAVPWSWAFDAPFSWTKQVASHFGGIRQGMAISWPAVIKDRGGIRNQFHHVIDVVPTILEAAKIRQPEVVDGIKQSPIEGVSMAYTFDAKNASRALDPQDAVLRDVRRPRHLPRGLDRQHQGDAPALERARRRRRDSRQVPVGALRPPERLDPVGGPRREESEEGEGDGGDLLAGGEEVRRDAARRDGGDSTRHAAPEHHRRAQRLHLDPAPHRHAQRRRAQRAERVVQLQGRGRGPAGRRRGRAHHAGRPLRRLRVLPAPGEAGLHLEPRRPGEDQVGRA